MKRIASTLLLIVSGYASAYADAPKTYGQALVDQSVASHPEVLVLAMHAKPPKSKDNVIVASNIGRIGKQADDDDMRVINTGEPNLAVNKAGDRFEAELPLLDVSGNRIGALGVVFAYKPGDDKAALQRKAEVIRDALKRRISNAKNLADPYPFDPSAPSDTNAQALVDSAMASHPELLILAIHASPAKGKDNIIIGSSIGRIGKKADEDDMRVINTGEPNLEVNENGNRFEVEAALLDKAGVRIGAVGIVFAYKEGDDKTVLRAHAEKIREELREKIPSNAFLFERPTH